jgi:hypothetical protein
MHFLTLLLLAAPAAYACSDNAYRCKNPDVSEDEMWKVTHSICNDLRRTIAIVLTGPSISAIRLVTISRVSRHSARTKARTGIGLSAESGTIDHGDFSAIEFSTNSL